MTPCRKILFYGSFTGGGTERITYNLASSLAENSQYDIYVMNTREVKPRFNLSPKVTYCYISNLGEHASILRTVARVRDFIKSQRFDVVVSIEALTGIILIPATFGLKCRTIVWEHANYYQTQGSRWIRWIRKLWLEKASAYIVLTLRDKKNFENNERTRCPIIQIYNPVKPCARKEYNMASTKIVSAGHLVPIKQFHLIPNIFAPLAQKYNAWTWHIYGEGPEREKIEKEIVKYNLQGRVILEGVTDNIDAVYDKSAIYVLTSRQEGLPTVLIEAQMHGLPAISFDIETGPDEIIEPDRTGYLVIDKDLSGMTDRIESLICDAERRKLFSENTANIHERFDYYQAIHNWQILIESMFQ